MTSDQGRRAEIEAAAYAVLQEVGYKSASLLLIAKRAHASTETLYRWYASKPGLFAALVKSNAAEVKALLEEAAASSVEPLDALRRFGPVLLTMLTGERAIALNRAAAVDSDETGQLGPLLAEHGRKTIGPLLDLVLGKAAKAGRIASDTDLVAARECYFALLIGDLQVRRVTGAILPLDADAVAQRADRALAQFLRVFGPGLSENS